MRGVSTPRRMGYRRVKGRLSGNSELLGTSVDGDMRPVVGYLIGALVRLRKYADKPQRTRRRPTAKKMRAHTGKSSRSNMNAATPTIKIDEATVEAHIKAGSAAAIVCLPW